MGIFDGIIKYIREPDANKERDAARAAINEIADEKLNATKTAANQVAGLAANSDISKTSKE